MSHPVKSDKTRVIIAPGDYTTYFQPDDPANWPPDAFSADLKPCAHIVTTNLRHLASNNEVRSTTGGQMWGTYSCSECLRIFYVNHEAIEVPPVEGSCDEDDSPKLPWEQSRGGVGS